MIIYLFKRLCKVSLILMLLVAAPIAVAEQKAAQQKILVFGDSLSAAYGMQKELGWVNLLAQKLNKQHIAASVINASISGETTSGGANRIQQTLIKHEPNIVVLELGGNDGLRGLSLQQIENNLIKILDASKKANAKILMIGMKIPPNYGTQYTKKFNFLFADLAEQYNARLVPFLLADIGGNRDLMQDDGLHPKAKAQAQILDNVWPELAPLLK